MRIFIAIVILACPLFAGQSLDLSGISGDSVPSPSLGGAAQSWRVEFHTHDAQPPASTVVAWLRFNNLGFYLTVLSNGDVQVIPLSSKDGFTGGFAFTVSGVFARDNALVRIQRDVAESRWSFEVWDQDGTNYQSTVSPRTSLTETTGTGTDLKALPASLGFLRIFDNTVPLNSRPPTTARAGNVAEWKFDGNLNDSAENGGLGAITLAGAAYVETPGQDFIALIAQTVDTPFWAPFRPMRAGHVNTLDATRSFSMADASDEVNCTWVQIDGPSRVRWLGEGGANSCTPQLSGLVFGPYDFRVVGVDAAGHTAEMETSIGAVAYDEKGVVIYPDDRLYDLLGPTTVLGANPWEWLDSQHVAMAQGNWNNYAINGGEWESEFNPPNRTMNGVPREGVVWVNHASTPQKVYGSGTNFIRVFGGGRAGPVINKGAQVFLFAEMARIRNERVMFRSYNVTNIVSDTELDVSGAEFSTTEANAVPWATRRLGDVFEGSTGTVFADPSVDNRKVYGIGTNFLSEFCGGEVGPSTSNLERLLVQDDTASLRYRVASCESDTELTLFEDWTGASINAPGKIWLRQSANNRGEWSTANGPASFVNYYDNVASFYSLYYRTGWKKALEAARFVSERHWKHWQAVWRNRSYRGSIISFEIDSGYTSSMKTAEDRDIFWKMAKTDISQAFTRNECLNNRIEDVRESAYCFEAMALIAKYSPESESRELARASLIDAYDTAVDTHLHPSGAILMHAAPQDGASNLWWNFTNGSTTVTKAGGSAEADANYCGDVSTFYDTGTVEITGEDMRTITVTGGNWTGQSGKTIMLHGLLDGQPYSQRNVLNSATASGGTLSYTWPGDGHPAKYRLTQGGSSSRRSLFTIRVNPDGTLAVPQVMDPDHWHWCTVDSPTQLTLERPWGGPTEVRRIRFHATGTQASTLMYGIFAMGMLEVAEALADYDAVAAAKYRFAADEQMRFYEDTQTEFSGAATFPYFPYHSQVCEPRYVFPNACSNTSENWNVNVMRAFSIETFRYISKRYLHTQDEADRVRGEEWSRRLFARAGFAAPVAGDGNWSATINPGDWQSSITQLTKNHGQAFGQGGTQTWSAVREGGVTPKPSVTRSVGFLLPAGAEDVRYVYRAPDGTETVTVCTTSPCAVAVDPRSGRGLLVKQVRDDGGNVLAESSQALEVF